MRCARGALAAFAQALDGEIAIQHRDDDLAIPRRDGAIHHQDVTALDSGVSHGATLNPDEECGRWVAHEVLVEIERVLHVVLGRRGKPSLYARGSQRDAQLGAGLEGDRLADDHEDSVRPRADGVKSLGYPRAAPLR